MSFAARSIAVASLLVAASSIAFVACSSSSSDGGAATPPPTTGGGAGAGGSAGGAGGGPAAGSGGSAGGSSAVRAAHKTSCTYEIKPRMEYLNVYDPNTKGDTTGEAVSATPNITHLRLGLGGHIDPTAPDRPDASTSIAVAWETDLGTTATTVQFGASMDPSTWAPTDVVDGLSYEVDPPTGALDGSPIRVHEAHLCGLKPATTYYYRAGGGPAGSEQWSDVRTFTTLSSSPDDTVTVGVIGDSRGENMNAWQLVQERLHKRGDIQIELFSGDMTDFSTSLMQYESWLSHGETDTQGKPSMLGETLALFAMGNHENYQTNYFASVVQPDDSKVAGKWGELFFSLEIGAAHVVVMDDLAIGNGSNQDLVTKELAWLDADLKAAVANRATRPWIIVDHHHGEWTSSTHAKDADVKKIRTTLAPIWDQYKVDLVLDGHDHNYERSKPCTINADGTPNLGTGTTYVVCAGAGADGYSNGMGPATQLSFSYSNEGALGVYGILTISKSKLSFEAHELTAAGDDPVKDSFDLSQ